MFRRALFALISLSFAGCYSFTGSSIPPNIHTIGIPLVEDNSGFGQSDVRQALTDLLIQKFTNEGSLQVASRTNSDAVIETSIPEHGITDEPVSVKAGEIATTKRVTLRVHATYRDQKKQKLFWDRDFSQTSDYPVSESLAGLRKAIRDAEDKMANDLLLAVISNW